MSCISNLLFTCIPCLCDIKFYKQKKKKKGTGFAILTAVFTLWNIFLWRIGMSWKNFDQLWRLGDKSVHRRGSRSGWSGVQLAGPLFRRFVIYWGESERADARARDWRNLFLGSSPTVLKEAMQTVCDIVSDFKTAWLKRLTGSIILHCGLQQVNRNFR